MIDGKITTTDMSQLQDARDQLLGNRSIKIMAIVLSFKGYESVNAMKEALLGDLLMVPKLSRYAIVTDVAWLRRMVSLLNYVVPTSELKAFTLLDRAPADAWLR